MWFLLCSSVHRCFSSGSVRSFSLSLYVVWAFILLGILWTSWISGLVSHFSLGKWPVISAAGPCAVCPCFASGHSRCTCYFFVVVPWPVDTLIFSRLCLFSLCFSGLEVSVGMSWSSEILPQRPLGTAGLMAAGFLLFPVPCLCLLPFFSSTFPCLFVVLIKHFPWFLFLHDGSPRHILHFRYGVLISAVSF